MQNNKNDSMSLWPARDVLVRAYALPNDSQNSTTILPI